MDARVEHDHDVGVSECRNRSSLTLEALEAAAVIIVELIAEELDGDAAAEDPILSFVDLAHAATTQASDERVAPADQPAGVGYLMFVTHIDPRGVNDTTIRRSTRLPEDPFITLLGCGAGRSSSAY
jgi:hypothetical protein